MLWNHMARSASIEVIGLHNVFMGTLDSVYFCYDDRKTDNIGGKVSKIVLPLAYIMLNI